MAETIKKPNTYWGSPESYAIKKTLDTIISCVNDLIENGGGSGGGESGGGESGGGGSVTPLNWELLDTVTNPAIAEGAMSWDIRVNTVKDGKYPKAVKVIGTANVETNLGTKLNASTEYLTISVSGNNPEEPTKFYTSSSIVGRSEIEGNRVEYYFYPDTLLGINIAEIAALQELAYTLESGSTVTSKVMQSCRGYAENNNYSGVNILFLGTYEDSGSLLRQDGSMTFEVYAAY